MSSTYIERTNAYNTNQQSFGMSKVRPQLSGSKPELKVALPEAKLSVNTPSSTEKPIKKISAEPAAIFELSKKSVVEENSKKTEELQKEVNEKTEKRTEESEKKMEELGKKMNELMDVIDGNSLKFKKHDDSGEFVMVLIDKVTEEEVRQVPSELFLSIASTFKEYLDSNEEARKSTGEAAKVLEDSASKAKDERAKAYLNFNGPGLTNQG